MKILLPVDGSACCEAALRFVAARPFEPGRVPEIELLHVQPPLPPLAGRAVDPDFAVSWYEAESQKVLQPAIDLLQAAGIRPAWFHRTGDPGLVIAQWAEERGCELVVMGSHGRTALKNLLFGSVTQTVLASTAVPLLVVRGVRQAPAVGLRVGVALDGSECSLAAARFILDHLDFFGPDAAFTLLHVFEEGAAPPVDAPQLLATADALAGRGRSSGQAILHGRPGEQIARWALDAQPDLLVMGSHGHGALTSAILGSVAWRTAAGCSTPLLLVRCQF
jgi:nucleotide-binding universal stress UspA family protein